MLGIYDGMVMQRNQNNVCDITVTSELPLQRVMYAGVKEGIGDVEGCGNNQYRITGVPTGGPYTLFIDNDQVTDVYVGDVWLLAGQSNMQGVGRPLAQEQGVEPDPEVRAYYMDNVWRPAAHPLHRPWEAFDKIHTDVLHAPQEPPHRAVGPGVAFGAELKKLTGVPQGLLCCAHGGTSLAHWSPAHKSLGGDQSLYGAMLRRYIANGSHVRGMFWYQGCSDALENCVDTFESSTISLYEEFRRDFGAELPIVQVQICRMADCMVNARDKEWETIRELQRTLDDKVPHLCTIATLPFTLDDLIHLSGTSQNTLGKQAARCMFRLINGEQANDCLLPPRFEGLRIAKDPFTGNGNIEITYTHLAGNLVSQGRPTGFALTTATGEKRALIFDTQLNGNRVILRTDIPAHLLNTHLVYYGRGMDPYCNITDSQGRSLPGMGPIPVPELAETV